MTLIYDSYSHHFHRTAASDSDGSSDSESDVIVDRLQHDLHSFDFESDEFRNLAPQTKHDILSDLKDTRKQNSWGKLDQMPKVRLFSLFCPSISQLLELLICFTAENKALSERPNQKPKYDVNKVLRRRRCFTESLFSYFSGCRQFF